MNHHKLNKERLEDAEKEFLSHLPETLREYGKEARELEEERKSADTKRLAEIDARISEIKDEIYHLIADAGKDRRLMS